MENKDIMEIIRQVCKNQNQLRTDNIDKLLTEAIIITEFKLTKEMPPQPPKETLSFMDKIKKQYGIV